MHVRLDLFIFYGKASALSCCRSITHIWTLSAHRACAPMPLQAATFLRMSLVISSQFSSPVHQAYLKRYAAATTHEIASAVPPQ